MQDLGYGLNCSCSANNNICCRCPFNLTGEDWSKQITINYDLHFTDESKSSSASLVVPFKLQSDELSIAMWVSFDTPDETGTYFSLYSVDHEFYPINKRILVQAQNSGVFVNFFENEKVFLQFQPSVPIVDGQWHHVVLTWSGKTGLLSLTADGIRADIRDEFGQDRTLQEFGYVTLGSTETGDGRLRIWLPCKIDKSSGLESSIGHKQGNTSSSKEFEFG